MFKDAREAFRKLQVEAVAKGVLDSANIKLDVKLEDFDIFKACQKPVHMKTRDEQAKEEFEKFKRREAELTKGDAK